MDPESEGGMSERMSMPPMPPRARQVIESVCAEFGLSYDAIVRGKRDGQRGYGGSVEPSPLVVARWQMMAGLRALKRPDGKCLFSMPRIGQFLGGMDHTSVLHGLRRWAEIQPIIHSPAVFCGSTQTGVSDAKEPAHHQLMYSNSSQEHRPCLT
jgi:hypothetical protein